MPGMLDWFGSWICDAFYSNATMVGVKEDYIRYAQIVSLLSRKCGSKWMWFSCLINLRPLMPDVCHQSCTSLVLKRNFYRFLSISACFPVYNNSSFLFRVLSEINGMDPWRSSPWNLDGAQYGQYLVTMNICIKLTK